MSELKEYIPPLVEPKYFGKYLKKLGSLEIILHGLLPHKRQKDAIKIIEESDIGNEVDLLYAAASDMYKESIERINGIEEKNFKLLNYISLVSAVSLYFLSKDVHGGYKISILVSLGFLVLAIIISLRCIGLKSQQALFIDTVFEFDNANPPKSRTKKSVTANLYNYAVYNNAVASNTADILKAARMMLSLGIISTVVACVFYIENSSRKEPEKTYKTTVTFSDSALIKKVESHIEFQDATSKELNTLLRRIGTKIDSLKKK